MLLLDAADSAYSARIEHAANDAGLSVQHLDSLDAMPADAPLIGVGPSISDPLDVARHLRGIGGQALLVFFTDSKTASRSNGNSVLKSMISASMPSCCNLSAASSAVYTIAP